MQIELEFDGSTTRMSLVEFFAQNGDLIMEETTEIERALQSGAVYTGGGGAAPTFTIRPIAEGCGQVFEMLANLPMDMSLVRDGIDPPPQQREPLE